LSKSIHRDSLIQLIFSMLLFSFRLV